jgi:homoserine kinase
MNEIKIFCPATIANLSCGFDSVFAWTMWGDEMIIRKSNQKGIRITKVVGADLLETERNVAGVAGLALLDAVETDFGFDIEIYKI